MNPTPSTPNSNSGNAPQAVVRGNAVSHNTQTMSVREKQRVSSVDAKPVGYGLPCAKCRTYYAADLKSCPVCKSTERVSPKAAPVRATVTTNDPVPDLEELEAEREKFLREFQAQVLASQGGTNPTPARCVRDENHPDNAEPSAICQGCYDQLQERVDVLEAALHMDVKEAAQIVYDAVWADPSDPNKTYLNAATALLAELKKRSGVTPTFRPLQPMLD
jgi:hypothetical protein